MREIEFRGKRLDNGEWVYGSLFNTIWRYHKDNSRACYIFPDEMLDIFGGDSWEDFADVAEDYEVDPATVGQYTGLKDKNGKKIYEGDIVGGSNGSVNGYEWPFQLEVRWEEDMCRFFVPKWKNMDSTHYYEVLGNIHDNPELRQSEAKVHYTPQDLYKANKEAKVGAEIECPSCHSVFVKTQYSQAFCCGKCKDAYHNKRNPDRHLKTEME